MKTALIIVDAQRDFVGPSDGYIIEDILELVDDADVVIATRSVHPADHFSFAEFGSHCVSGTKGMRLDPRLDEIPDYTTTTLSSKQVEHYSAFDGGTLRPKESLEEILINEGVQSVWVVGFGHGWDVPQTAFDANALGYPTTIWLNAIKKLEPEMFPRLERAGVKLADGRT